MLEAQVGVNKYLWEYPLEQNLAPDQEMKMLLQVEMQKVIEAENSDLFDVLAYVSFAAAPVTRAARAAAARAATAVEFTDKPRAFVDFVLAQYVSQGVDELDAEKLSPLLKLKYRNAIADAFVELGQPEQVRQVFVGFQRHLYSS
jgi:type I restriction enzyme R subunit